MARDSLDSIMPVVKSFHKYPSIVKIKAKAFDSTFHFKKTNCNEVEKIISNKKTCQQEDILSKIIRLNKDLIAKFIAENYNSCIDEGEFPSELNMLILSKFIKRKLRVTKLITDQ